MSKYIERPLFFFDGFRREFVYAFVIRILIGRSLLMGDLYVVRSTKDGLKEFFVVVGMLLYIYFLFAGVLFFRKLKM